MTRASSPTIRPTRHLDEDRLQHHLVEARLREVAGREGVLARDRLEHGLDARAAGLDGQRDEAARVGQEGERAQDGLALAGVALEEALLHQGLELARRQSGGRVEEERGAGQPVEPPGRHGPGHAGRVGAARPPPASAPAWPGRPGAPPARTRSRSRSGRAARGSSGRRRSSQSRAGAPACARTTARRPSAISSGEATGGGDSGLDGLPWGWSRQRARPPRAEYTSTGGGAPASRSRRTRSGAVRARAESAAAG